ncbi:MAG: DUF4105 domain-containing protein [Tahibacter sp.]
MTALTAGAALLRRSLAVIAMFLLVAPALQAADAQWIPGQDGEKLSVSLLTFGPGEIYWERFGHNAILIRDSASGESLSYNYGIFDFEEKDFFLNFLRGRMDYSMAANRGDDDIAMYAQEGRWVQEQGLNLSPPQRLALQKYLQWNLSPENAKYRYEYFTANCSTRVRDALDQALGGELRRQLSAPSRGYTFRLHADHLMAGDPVLMLPMDLGLGPFADRHLSFWDESFAPGRLMLHLAQVQIHDDSGTALPLVSSDTPLAKAKGSPRIPVLDSFPVDTALPAGVLGTLCAGLLLWMSGRRRAGVWRVTYAVSACVVALTMTFAGLALLALWGLTEHISAWRNENLLLLNPLVLLLIPSYWRGRGNNWRISRFAQRLSTLVLSIALLAPAIKVLPWFVQNNGVWIALLLPVHLALFLSLRKAKARGPSIFRDNNRLIGRA